MRLTETQYFLLEAKVLEHLEMQHRFLLYFLYIVGYVQPTLDSSLSSGWIQYYVTKKENLLEKCFCKPRNATKSIATETYSDSPKNLRIEGVEAINRGNQRRKRDFSRPFAGGVG
ncbi:uncharacterized protein [Tenebrio molitor]|uniref:uncharacterized protein n=1 Tax=Tenebrio molitor TaxID=7067 RepID=UPI0036246B5D